MKPKIFLDVDTGTDDAIAILLAIKSNQFEIEGITTSFGNTNLRQATLNTSKILNLVNRLNIPVFRGASKPLKNGWRRGKTHGRDGLCEVDLPLPNKKEGKMPAQKFIYQTLSESPQKIRTPDLSGNLVFSKAIARWARPIRVEDYIPKIIIISLAPLTNIALVLKNHPNLKKRIERIYVMGGVVETKGNITPFAEFNFYNDPVAAKIVFESNTPLTLIPLDVTRGVYLRRDRLLKKYGQSEDPITKFIVNLVDNRYKLTGKDLFYLHDPLAIGVAINKHFVEFKNDRLGIITSGKQRGRIIKTDYGQKLEWAFRVNPSPLAKGDRVKKKEFLNYFEKILLRKE